jgi:DNA-directed RNA polymerase alpha subunit
MVKMLHIQQAQELGYTIDNHAGGRPLAYKGARFNASEWHPCYTELESQLIEMLEVVLDVSSFNQRDAASVAVRCQAQQLVNEHRAFQPEIGLPVTIWHLLREVGIHSTADLTSKTYNEVLKTPGIGYSRMAVIERALMRVGLSFKELVK